MEWKKKLEILWPLGGLGYGTSQFLFKGQRDDRTVKALALPVADPDSISSISYSPPGPPEVIPEHQIWPQNKIKQYKMFSSMF